MINGASVCATANTPEAVAKRKLVRDTFRKARANGDIYAISEYADESEDEFLAETFAARWLGETLPGYIVDMLVRCFG